MVSPWFSICFSLLSRENMKLFIILSLFGLSLAQHNPHTKHGRTAIVHLFEWRWADIAAECERFLAPNGYGGVQVCTLWLRGRQSLGALNVLEVKRYRDSSLAILLLLIQLNNRKNSGFNTIQSW